MKNHHVVGLAVVGAFIMGALLGGQIGAGSSGASPSRTGHARSEKSARTDGPVEAALAAVTAQPRLYRTGGIPAVEADIRSRTIPEAQSELVGQFRSGMERVADAWPEGPTGWWLAPLATRHVWVGTDRATVEVWFSEVIIPPSLEPYADWRTTTLEMQRTDGDWKVASSRDGAAPFLRTDPNGRPAQRPDLVDFLAGYEEPGRD